MKKAVRELLANRLSKPKRKAPKKKVYHKAVVPKGVESLQEHPQWSKIHYDIVTSQLSPSQICSKYNIISAKTGTFPIMAVASYKRKLMEKYPDLFQFLDKAQKEALLEEYLNSVRASVQLSEETRALAKENKIAVRKGKEVVMVKSPHYVTMLEAEKNRLGALDKFKEIIGIGVPAGPQFNVGSVDNSVNVLAMPKLNTALPSRTPTVKVIDSPK